MSMVNNGANCIKTVNLLRKEADDDVTPQEYLSDEGSEDENDESDCDSDDEEHERLDDSTTMDRTSRK